MKNRRKVFSNSILYSFSSLLIKSFNFALLPLYTYSMSANQYGVINLVNSFKTVSILLISFSLYSAVIRFHVDYADDTEKLRQFIGTLIVFVFFSGSVFFVIGLIFNELVISVFFEGINYYPIVLITFISLIFISLHTLHQTIIQATENGKKLSIVNITVFLFQAVLIFILVGIMKLESLGYVIALLITNFIYFFYMIYDLKSTNLVSFNLDFISLSRALKYSIPLMPHELSTQIANFASRVFLNRSTSLASVGLYSVAFQFGVVVDTVQFSVNKAFSPWFFKLMKHKNIDGMESVKVSNVLLYMYSIIFLIIGLFSQEAIFLMTPPSYGDAWKVVPLIVVGYSIKSIYYFYINVLLFYKNASKKIFIATLSGSVIEIMLSVILISTFGMYGAAFSFIAGKIITVSVIIIISKSYNHNYNVLVMIKIIAPSIITMYLGLIFSYYQYSSELSFINITYKLLILSLYSLYIYFLNRNMLIKSTPKIIEELKKNKVIRRVTSFIN